MYFPVYPYSYILYFFYYTPPFPLLIALPPINTAFSENKRSEEKNKRLKNKHSGAYIRGNTVFPRLTLRSLILPKGNSRIVNPIQYLRKSSVF